MILKLTLYLSVILLLVSCQERDTNSSEILKNNIDALNRQNEFDIRFLNLIDSKTKHLLNLERPNPINSDSLDTVIANVDETYFNESIEKLQKLKNNYNSSLKSKICGV